MHMADALISPAVGGTMLVISSGLALYSARHVRKNFDPERIPLMGVMGAFVFAMQMINFAIPGTGSSGHIGGAVLLAALLGAHPAFLALACVLAIQALFFADGGLLALGCNIFNMGFFACFIAYPLIFRPIAGDFSKPARVMCASVLACVVGLQLGAFCVVLQTLLSGVTELPFATFALLMQPIHLAIGAVEGVLTGMVVLFVLNARPQLLNSKSAEKGMSFKATLASILLATALIGGGLSLLASGDPDGLEWAIERTAGEAELSAEGGIYTVSANIQEKSSFLPDYSVPGIESEIGTSIAGIAGGTITLLLIAGMGFVLARRKDANA